MTLYFLNRLFTGHIGAILKSGKKKKKKKKPLVILFMKSKNIFHFIYQPIYLFTFTTVRFL